IERGDVRVERSEHLFERRRSLLVEQRYRSRRSRLCLSFVVAIARLDRSRGRVDEFENQEPVVVAIAQQFYVAADLLDGLLVELSEITGDADKAWRRPLNGVGHFDAKLLLSKQCELGLVIEQPIKVVEALVDDVLGSSSACTR